MRHESKRGFPIDQLKNAVKIFYANPTIQTARLLGKAADKVKDIHLSTEDQEKIFKPFLQTPMNPTTNKLDFLRTENPQTFGQYVKVLRDIQCLTQKELGEELGVQEELISKYENGTSIPKKPKRILQLIEILHIPEEYHKPFIQSAGITMEAIERIKKNSNERRENRNI